MLRSSERLVRDGTTITEQVATSDIANIVAGDNDPPAQTQSSQRTLTWVQGSDGNWLLASERINSIRAPSARK